MVAGSNSRLTGVSSFVVPLIKLVIFPLLSTGPIQDDRKSPNMVEVLLNVIENFNYNSRAKFEKGNMRDAFSFSICLFIIPSIRPSVRHTLSFLARYLT